MRQVTFAVYGIEEHPDKEKCFTWIRNNWYDLSQHVVDEHIESLKALQNVISGNLNYSISACSDRGEFIRLSDFDKEILDSLDNDMSLTGVYCDQTVIKAFKENDMNMILNSIHSGDDYIYSDEGLMEFCKANGYEFYENGQAV